MKARIFTFLIFLVINFGALAIGGIFTSEGVGSEWYISMNQAPWTPPGWFFGVAWTTIMICFTFFMTKLWTVSTDKKALIALFFFQWILNVGWNPVFFYFKEEVLGLLIISVLTIVVGFYFFSHLKSLRSWSLFVAPYFIWLLIATSLNAYIVLMN